ncbi:13367_t:CDS:2 [Dentiscutata erythropus]|uniref:13367_t:CDS:1 n=1 Tax=Dentiscutata erythropus TaxID=1348616 RepID=A0A9N9CU86_9GLOM|nr:13367_t:CDS:2 [Dentiscutata erythropus]
MQNTQQVEGTNRLIKTELPATHEYIDGYLENEYDTLQALLENLVNMVNPSDYFMIEGTAVEELDSNEQINQLISIRGPDAYQASIHTSITRKQEYAYVDEFAGLIEKFIENHTDVDVNNRMMIEVTRIKNPKKLKHKGCPKIPKYAKRSRSGCRKFK